MRRSCQHRPFKPERAEHWLDRYEREVEEQQDLLDKWLREEKAKPDGDHSVQPARERS